MNVLFIASYTHPNYTSMFTGRYSITRGGEDPMLAQARPAGRWPIW